MGSLRIAMKQSLQDATSIGGGSTDVTGGVASLQPKGNKKSKGSSSRAPSSVKHQDEDNASSSSEENEASLKDLEDDGDDSTIDEETQPKTTVVEWDVPSSSQQKAAHQIQKHFRRSIAKSKKGGGSKFKVRSSSKKRRRALSTETDDHSQSDSDGSSQETTWTVAPPTDTVLQHMASLSADVCRKHMQTPGLRVKVLFDQPTVQWYGGRVRRVRTDAAGQRMHIGIQYDDGTQEETNFPDRKYNDRSGLMVDTVIVDAEGNGQHDAAVQDAAMVFLPPNAMERTALAPKETTAAVVEHPMVEEKGKKDEMDFETKDRTDVKANMEVSPHPKPVEPSMHSLDVAVKEVVALEKDISDMVTEPQNEPTIAPRVEEDNTSNANVEPPPSSVDQVVAATTTETDMVLEPPVQENELHSMGDFETTVFVSMSETATAPLNSEGLDGNVAATADVLPETTTRVESPETPQMNDLLESSMEGTAKPEAETAKLSSEAAVESNVMESVVEGMVAEVPLLESDAPTVVVATSVGIDTTVVDVVSDVKPIPAMESDETVNDIVNNVDMMAVKSSAYTTTDLVQEKEIVNPPETTLPMEAVRPEHTVVLSEPSSTSEEDTTSSPMTEPDGNVASKVEPAVDRNATDAALPVHHTITVLNSEAESLEVGSDVPINVDGNNSSSGEPMTIDEPVSSDTAVSMPRLDEKTASDVESAVPTTAPSESGDAGAMHDAEPAMAAVTSKASESPPTAVKECPPAAVERVKLTLSLKRPAPAAAETEQPPTKKLTIRIPIPKVVQPNDPVAHVASPSKVAKDGSSLAISTSIEGPASAEAKLQLYGDDAHRMELDPQNVVASPRQLKKLEKKKKKLLAAASKNLEGEDLSGSAGSKDGLSTGASKKSTDDEKLAMQEDDLLIVDSLDGFGRSERRAAQHANERITAKSDGGAVVPSEEVIAKKKKKANRRKEADGGSDHLSNAENEIELDDSQWVQCDKCGKWRIIPNSVVQLLPTQWYCADNVYDPKHASCEAPEQTDKDVAREKKKRLKKKQRLLKAAEEAASNEVSTPKSDNAKIEIAIPKDVDRSPRPPRDTKEDVEKQAKQPKRSTPLDETLPVQLVADARPKKEKKVASLAVKRGRSVESLDKLAPAVEEPVAVDATKPRGRGRPRRVNNVKEATTTAVGSSIPTPTDDGENLEWVQCEKCDKWRKLPPHVSADDLPDVWTCDMNNWNPMSASCDAPEDKSEGLQDIGVFGSSGSAAGKLTYRHLIFGSNGRKANRPVSEKTRAAESIFAAHLDEEDAPSKVLYSDSSVYVSRGRANFPNDENEGMSVLELMSHSQLWQELRGITWSASPSVASDPQRNPDRMNSFVLDNLTVDMQDLMKEYVLHVLDAETLSVNDIVRRALSQNVDSLPQKLQPAQPYCSENVVVTTLCELVKSSRAECIQKIGSSSDNSFWNPYYRRKIQRVLPQNDTPSQVAEGSIPPRTKFSHLMKLSKPWKRTQWRQQE